MSKQTKKTKFYGCYLLESLHQTYKNSTYIGFTVNPKKRIKQHNGEIKGGAFKTKRKRPWRMILCTYGFPTQVAALQFEWAWQNPQKSRLIKKQIGKVGRPRSVNGQLKLLYQMLNIKPWCNFPLHIQYMNDNNNSNILLLIKNKEFQELPPHIDITIGSINDLYLCHVKETKESDIEGDYDFDDDDESDSENEAINLVDKEPIILDDIDDDISMKNSQLNNNSNNKSNNDSNVNDKDNINNHTIRISKKRSRRKICALCDDNPGYSKHINLVTCPYCSNVFHVICLATYLLKDTPKQIIPDKGTCIICNKDIVWATIVERIRSNNIINDLQLLDISMDIDTHSKAVEIAKLRSNSILNNSSNNNSKNNNVLVRSSSITSNGKAIINNSNNHIYRSGSSGTSSKRSRGLENDEYSDILTQKNDENISLDIHSNNIAELPLRERLKLRCGNIIEIPE